jgi:cell division GTPase FtsZ
MTATEIAMAIVTALLAGGTGTAAVAYVREAARNGAAQRD